MTQELMQETMEILAEQFSSIENEQELVDFLFNLFSAKSYGSINDYFFHAYSNLSQTLYNELRNK